MTLVSSWLAGRTSFARFWRDTGLYGAASFLAGIANYFFSVALAHGLGPSRYGTVVSLLNATSILLIPSPIVALIYTRIGRRKPPGWEPWLLWGLGLSLWAGTWLVSPRLGSMLHVGPELVALFAAGSVPSFAAAANLGALQRSRRYDRAGLLAAGTSALNLAAVLIALLFHFPNAGFGLALSLVPWLTWYASRLFSERIPPGEPTPASGLLLGTGTVGALYTLFSLTDSLIARHALSARHAGLYVGLSTVGSSLTFFSGTFGTVMLTAILQDRPRALRYLARAALLYAATAAVGEGLFVLAGPLVLNIVLGQPFLPVRTLLPVYGLGMAALGFLNVLLLYSVALRRWAAVWTALAGYLAWVALLTSAHALPAFALRTAATLIATLLATALVLFLPWRRWVAA